jgi:hypothetical protein
VEAGLTQAEYLDFVRTLYRDLLEPSVVSPMSLRQRHPFHEYDELLWEIDRLAQTMQALRFMNRSFSTNDDLSRYFRPALFSRIRDGSTSGLSWTTRLLGDDGAIDGIQENFEDIVEGMSLEYFPEADTDILARSGSSDPRAELNAIIYKIKMRRTQLKEAAREVPFRERINQGSQRITAELERVATDGDENQEQRPVTRRLFKGLAGVVQGSLLTLVNVAVVSSIWAVPVTEDTKAVGSVMSITTGIGCILNGIGEFRGE